jgi:hypothetical protein
MSELCFEACSHLSSAAGDKPTSSLLPGDAVTHYLIPFTDVVAKFMEVLEVGEFTGSREFTKNVGGSGIRCAFLTPGSGWLKKQNQGPGSRSVMFILESLETIFWVKNT